MDNAEAEEYLDTFDICFFAVRVWTDLDDHDQQ